MSVFLAASDSLFQTEVFFSICSGCTLNNRKSQDRMTHALSLSQSHTHSMVRQKCIGGFESVRGEFTGREEIRESWEMLRCQ